MNWSWRKNKQGGKYRSYLYHDPKHGKNARLRKEASPQFSTDIEADEWCRKWEAENDAARVRIEKRLDAESKFHNFKKLIEIFEKDMRLTAPNSWENTMTYFRLYVLPFFLGEKGSNNIHNLSLHYAEYRDWLQVVGKVRGGGLLSGQSRNLAITALNNFLRSMKSRGELTGIVETCSQFSSATTHRRGAEAVIQREDRERIYQWLFEHQGKDYADFLDALLESGMRINELMGISLADVHERDLIADRLKDMLGFYGIDFLGYKSFHAI